MPTLRTTTAFCGLPFAPLNAVPTDAVAAVVGVGYSLGTPHSGTENGPYFLRTVSKVHTWSAEAPAVVDLSRGCLPIRGVVDLGDLDFSGMTLTEAQEVVERTVAVLPPDVVPAVIGGDHSVTLPVVTALAARRSEPFSVVQFDQHLDLQIWDGAPSRLTVRESIFHTNVMSHVSDRIGPGRLVQVGVSPYATVEAGSADAMPGFLRTIGTQVSVVSPEIHDPEAFQAVIGRGRDVYLTVDVDVLDRTVMSSTGYPADIGLSAQDLLGLIGLVLEGNRLIGFDLVEFAAPRDARDPVTLADATRAMQIFLHVLGWACRQASTRTRKEK